MSEKARSNFVGSETSTHLKAQAEGLGGAFVLAVSRLAHGRSGFTRTATREIPGTASLSSCSLFGIRSVPMLVSPVRFPPGRARLVTSPSRTGSSYTTNTIGTVLVALLGDEGWACYDDEEINLKSDEVNRQSEDASSSRHRLPLHETILGDDVSSLDPTEVAKGTLKRYRRLAGSDHCESHPIR